MRANPIASTSSSASRDHHRERAFAAELVERREASKTEQQQNDHLRGAGPELAAHAHRQQCERDAGERVAEGVVQRVPGRHGDGGRFRTPRL